LQYELDSFKQERELANLRHEKELRDAQTKAEADFKRAQVRWPPVMVTVGELIRESIGL
jgi:hypothetical protein